MPRALLDSAGAASPARDGERSGPVPGSVGVQFTGVFSAFSSTTAEAFCIFGADAVGCHDLQSVCRTWEACPLPREGHLGETDAHMAHAAAGAGAGGDLCVREVVALIVVERQAQPALVLPQVIPHEVRVLRQVNGFQSQSPEPLPPINSLQHASTVIGNDWVCPDRMVAVLTQ